MTKKRRDSHQQSQKSVEINKVCFYEKKGYYAQDCCLRTPKKSLKTKKPVKRTNKLDQREIKESKSRCYLINQL